MKRTLAAIILAVIGPLVVGPGLEDAAPELAGAPLGAAPAQANVPGQTAWAATNTPAQFLEPPADDEPIPSDTEEESARAELRAALCPADMVLVEGAYCSDVRHTCKHWLDDEKLPYARCGEYEPTAKCVGQRVRMRYCVDRHEYTRSGEERPMNYASFVTASKVCKGLGKRLCTESEWNFACEGEEMRPYPYGFARTAQCNQDQPDLYERTPKRLLLKDLRAAADAHPQCASPFGVYGMVGNMDEPVLRDGARYAQPFRNALKGGWWMSGRNRCRPATTAHDDYYQDIQVGVRCCSDAPRSEPGATG